MKNSIGINFYKGEVVRIIDTEYVCSTYYDDIKKLKNMKLKDCDCLQYVPNDPYDEIKIPKSYSSQYVPKVNEWVQIIDFVRNEITNENLVLCSTLHRGVYKSDDKTVDFLIGIDGIEFLRVSGFECEGYASFM